jgi:hypothetical protein
VLQLAYHTCPDRILFKIGDETGRVKAEQKPTSFMNPHSHFILLKIGLLNLIFGLICRPWSYLVYCSIRSSLDCVVVAQFAILKNIPEFLSVQGAPLAACLVWALGVPTHEV